MFHIALYEPEIPPNTGNIIRLAANIGATLHLIEPLGFSLDHKQLRRAGMDYKDIAHVVIHPHWQAFDEWRGNRRLLALTTKGKKSYHEIRYQGEDVLLFGPETRGLPEAVLLSLPDEQRIYLPMAANSRSLNLSNSVAVAAYEAWRQQDFYLE
ncbi:MAG TPA: tRNA (cytidine(34)-2'-O)-methyltransferase [Alcanivoracaceae bacterium]|nr:tRNA (cytidine(34)-2'-O)-methyltransferase [Alcanivoracaceae bacterium]